jgi:anti-sigma B factor antagonist
VEIDERDLSDGALVLTPHGRLNLVAAPRVRALVEERVQQGRTRIVFDLGDVAFLDSSGLGALIAGLKRAREAGGDLRLANAGEPVLMVLRLTKVDRVLRVHPDPETAFRDA